MIFTGRYEALSTPFLKEKEHRKCQNKQKEISLKLIYTQLFVQSDRSETNCMQLYLRKTVFSP